MAIYQDLVYGMVTISIPNIPSNSNILTALNSVDVATNITFSQTTIGIVATLLNPTIISTHKVIILENLPTSTTSITINQIYGSVFDLGIGKTTQLIWNGVSWIKFIGEALNSDDVNLRDRLTHTGYQDIVTIAGLQDTLDSKFNKIGGTLIGTSGDGTIGFPPQLTDTISPQSGFKLFANTSGSFSWMGVNGFMHTLSSNITSNRIYTLPNNNGTIALLSDVSSNWGAITGTLSSQTDLNNALNSRGLLSGTQSWTGVNTFTTIDIQNIKKNGSFLLHNYMASGTSGKNLFVGIIAGNTTLTGSVSSTQGSFNVGIGEASLSSLTTGNNNTATGYMASNAETSGLQNTSFGSNALAAHTSGNQNTAIGSYALARTTDGGSNVAIGASSCLQSYSASNTTAIGTNSLSVVSGLGNTAIGYSVGSQVSSGGNNTLVGQYTGGGLSTGSNNTIVGANVSGLVGTLTKTVIIADGTGEYRFYSPISGNVLLGSVVDSGQKLQVNGTSKFTGNITSSGDIMTNGDIGGRQVSAGDTYFNVSGNRFHYIRGQTRFTDATSGIVIGGTTKASSALVDIQSTTLGFLIPRMTTAQRNDIVATNGLQVYDTNLNKIFIHDGTSWRTVGAISGSFSATASATTTFTIPIGSTMADINYKVNVTPTTILSASSFYVNNKTPTTFDVSYLIELTGNIGFDYSISR